MRKLNWDEEYYISFILDSKRFSTPIGNGFSIRFEVENEINRLKTLGCSNIRVSIRKWS